MGLGPEPRAVGAAPTCVLKGKGGLKRPHRDREAPACACLGASGGSMLDPGECLCMDVLVAGLPAPARGLSHAKPIAPRAATPRHNASARHSPAQPAWPALGPRSSPSEWQPGDSQAHLMLKPFSGCQSEEAPLSPRRLVASS